MDAFHEEMHNVPFIMIEGMYAGSPEAGAQLLDPLRQLGAPLWDDSGTTTYLAVQSAFDDFIPDGKRYYWKSHFLNELSDASIQRIAAWARRRTTSASITVGTVRQTTPQILRGHASAGRISRQYRPTASTSTSIPMKETGCLEPERGPISTD